MTATPLRDRDADPALTLGMAAILHLAYDGGDLSDLWRELVQRIDHDPQDAAALMDLSMVLQAAGHAEDALNVQSQALALRRCYHRPHGRADGTRVVAILAPGDFMANMPIDFLLQGSDLDLWLVYTDDEGHLPDIPDHDVGFLALGESARNEPILKRLGARLAAWPRCVINAAPEVIAGLTRDGVHAMLDGEPSLVSPLTIRARRAELQAHVRRGGGLAALLPNASYPILIRPTGTHAGKGLQRLAEVADLARYIGEHPDDAFYLTPFIEYASPDGMYRKQRIAFIGGRAYPSHFATSAHWMVHYLSADMTEHAARRLEEAVWMTSFDAGFAQRHAAAFAALGERLGLDYFGIDCAEMPDGRLLIFEVDVAMIVHDLDSASTFPYKKPAMRRLFDAFCDLVRDRAGP
jgi:hypothetical protein